MAAVKHGDRWGHWQFDGRKAYLDHIPTDYNITLHPSNLVSQIFNSIRQIRAKTWGSPDELLDLLRAYSEIFESNRKFQNAFKDEISVRRDRWETFRRDAAALINQTALGSPEWNTRLEEIRNRFYENTSGK